MTTISRTLLGSALGVAATAVVAGSSVACAADTAAVLDTYADIAQAKLEDSLTTARALRTSVDALLDAPGDATLAAMLATHRVVDSLSTSLCWRAR